MTLIKKIIDFISKVFEVIKILIIDIFPYNIPILILLFSIGLYTYALIKYGGKPIDQIPSWVFFMLNGNGRSK